VTSTNADLLTIARTIALEAGALAARRRAEGVSVAASKSSTEDVVTAADREVELLIRTRLAEARPGDGFFGEESDASASETGLTWVVDPIDGTVNYLYGIPHYAVSIAVVEGSPDPAEWTILAGVVHNPASGEVFSATRGGGAFLGDSRLQIPAAPSFDQALIATGFSYSAARRLEQGAVVAELVGLVRDVRRMGSAALDLCAVAAGRVNGYFEGELNPWDMAAGNLIAEEAGAQVTGITQPHPGRSGIVVGPRSLVSSLQDVLIELGY
jgi:myo-inositol-1(or 4)-monophosphatase